MAEPTTNLTDIGTKRCGDCWKLLTPMDGEIHRIEIGGAQRIADNGELPGPGESKGRICRYCKDAITECHRRRGEAYEEART